MANKSIGFSEIVIILVFLPLFALYWLAILLWLVHGNMNRVRRELGEQLNNQ